MEKLSGRETLDLGAASLLAGLCMLWGFNTVTIKVSNLGVAPIFAAGIRSAIATLGLIALDEAQKDEPVSGNLLDGLVVGVLLGAEFGFVYSSLLHTTASPAWILLYTTPFFHAVEAHYLLKGDRLSLNKGMGVSFQKRKVLAEIAKEAAK